ncbi:polyphosphate kinase [bacterium BMS3Abin04]|nr:polyphosphate kinase [bacterium BMS3Abin04]
MQKEPYINREISWLDFNFRVLQEAEDRKNPLYERLKFLAIYSSNLDEYFRVRVAGVRSLLRLSKKTKKELDFDPMVLLKKIHKIVFKQQEEYGRIFREEIIPELRLNNIYLIGKNEFSDKQIKYVKEYFHQNIIPHIQPVLIVKKRIIPFLRNRRLYLAIKLSSKDSELNKYKQKRKQYKYAIVEIPSNHLPRFVEIPTEPGKTYIAFLDDIIRVCLDEIFAGYQIVSSYSIKLTRDAELYIDDEFSGNLLEKIKRSLKNRSIGAPSRFLYDSKIPKDFLKSLRESLLIGKENMIPGGRYHSLSDFFSFPNPGRRDLENIPLPFLRNAEMDKYPDIFTAIDERDFVLHFPYHTYDYVLEFLNKGASDPDVISIYITQYRVAKNSAVVSSLIRAVQNGKKVIAFVELKARFDEELNIHWAQEMKSYGIQVFYSFPGIKVHSKIALIKKKKNDTVKNYCYLGTGNFNEKTAQLYSDTGLFTSDERLTLEVDKVFMHLSGQSFKGKFKHLLVAQFNMRKSFTKMIDNEIKNANSGKKAWMILKMNSLEDRKIISKLYEASSAGVKIDLIIRGICCLVPGIEGLSENINAISIVDRYLEHSRIFVFYNNGNIKMFAGSADWMKRNLNRRIEVSFPIYDESIKKEILDILKIQLKDNVKTRMIDAKGQNKYKKSKANRKVQSQVETYYFLKKKNEKFFNI